MTWHDLSRVIAHWDEVEALPAREGADGGDMAARSATPPARRAIGVNRIRIEPGRLSTPPHSHNRAEEIFFVLGGSGLLVAGRGGLRGPRRRHDRPARGPRGAHASRRPRRARRARLRHAPSGRVRLAAALEARCASATCGPRAASTIRGTSRPRSASSSSRSRASGRRTSSRSTTSSWTRTATRMVAEAARLGRSPGSSGRGASPDAELAIPHCHSAEEEAFVVLEGDGTLELWPSPRAGGGRRRARDARDPRGRRRSRVRRARASRTSSRPARTA